MTIFAALAILAGGVFILLAFMGCSTIATQSEDGRTLTLRPGFLSSASAEFVNGARIKSESWQGPQEIGVNIDAPITAPLSLPPDLLKMPVGVNK
jgi:hypothetical protein